MSKETKKIKQEIIDNQINNKELLKQGELLVGITQAYHDIQEAMDGLIKNQKTFNKVTTANHEEIKKYLKKSEEEIEHLEAKLKFLEKIGKINKDDFKEAQELLKLRKEENEELKKSLSAYEKRSKLAEEISAKTKLALQNLTGITDKAKTLPSQYIQVMKEGGPLISGMVHGFKTFLGGDYITEGAGKTKAVLQALGNFATNILTSLLDKMISKNLEFIRELEQTEKKIMTVTGASEDAKAVLYDSFIAAKQYGVAIGEVGSAMEASANNVNKFNQMNVAQKQNLIVNIALLQEVGVKAGDATKLYNNLTTGLKMNHEQAIVATRSMAAYGATLGDNSKAAQEFNNALKILAGYGAKQALEIFDKLAHQAYATGLEISSLLSIASKFDTFESAATAAAGLNAILGGPLLNSTDLLTKSEAERIDILMRSINESGKAWAELNKFEQKAIASQVGINDLAEANKLFGKSFAEYQAGVKESEKLAAQQKEIEDRAVAAQTVMDRWGTVLDMFIIKMGPVVDTAEKFLTFIIELDETLGGYLIPAIMVLTARLAIMGFMLKSAGSVMSIFSIATQSTAAAAKPAEVGMKGIANGIKSIGAPGSSGFKAVLIIAALGFAFVEFAAAVWLIVEAITNLVPHLGTLFEVISKNKGEITVLGLELVAFGISLSILGAMAPLVAIGAVSLGLLAYAASKLISHVKEDDGSLPQFISDLSKLATNVDNLTRVPSILSSISTSLKETFVGLNVMEMLSYAVTLDVVSNKLHRYASALERVANSFSRLSGANLTTSVGNISVLVQEVNKLSSEKVEYMERLSNSTVKIMESSKDNKNQDVIQAIRELIGAVNGQTSVIENKDNKINIINKIETPSSIETNAILMPSRG
jgi:DNA-binding MltR family transcriptional regulator